jgi:L-ribulokinase
VEDAMQAMGQGFDAEYFPDPQRAAIYAKRYSQYMLMGNFIEQQTASQKTRVIPKEPSLK